MHDHDRYSIEYVRAATHSDSNQAHESSIVHGPEWLSTLEGLSDNLTYTQDAGVTDVQELLKLAWGAVHKRIVKELGSKRHKPH